MFILLMVVTIIFLIFYYIGIEIALDSIFAYLGIEGWFVFTVIGVICGFIVALINEEGYIRYPLFWGLAMFLIWFFRPDGFIYALILLGIYKLIFREA